MCPVELKFDVSIERAKDSLRKSDQRHSESLEDQRQHTSQPQTFLLLFLLKFICLSSKRWDDQSSQKIKSHLAIFICCFKLIFVLLTKQKIKVTLVPLKSFNFQMTRTVLF